jgi:hypothetical protein
MRPLPRTLLSVLAVAAVSLGLVTAGANNASATPESDAPRLLDGPAAEHRDG